MFRLLIVDDERTTREGLRDCVEWHKYGVEVAAIASNGQEALGRLHQDSIDIVLTDVVMPMMDGIELVKHIRQKELPVKIIFVSGYWDMPYLKSAFQLDAIDYILKPVKLTELEKVIRKVVSICIEEQNEKEALQELKSKLASSMPLLREQFFSKLISGKFRDMESIYQRASFLAVPFYPNSYFTVFTIQLNTIYGSQDIRETGMTNDIEKQEIEQMLIKEKLETYFDDRYLVYSLFQDQHIYLILNNEHSLLYDEFLSIAQQIQELVENITKSKASIGIGEEVSNIEHINRSWQKSIRALEEGCFLSENEIVHYRDIDFDNHIPAYYPHHIQEKIINAVRMGKEEAVCSLIPLFFRELYSNPHVSIDYIRTICMELVVIARRILLESSNSEIKKAHRVDLWKSIPQLKSSKETEEWLINQLVSMAHEIDLLQNKKTKSIISQIMEEVQKRCCEDITIQMLADEFHYTPNYICMLFKKETGESFKEFLTKMRIKKAKTLISNPSLKIYEVAEKVGYRDPDYFTRIFRKYIGVTPTEYRERSY